MLRVLQLEYFPNGIASPIYRSIRYCSGYIILEAQHLTDNLAEIMDINVRKGRYYENTSTIFTPISRNIRPYIINRVAHYLMENSFVIQIKKKLGRNDLAYPSYDQITANNL